MNCFVASFLAVPLRLRIAVLRLPILKRVILRAALTLKYPSMSSSDRASSSGAVLGGITCRIRFLRLGTDDTTYIDVSADKGFAGAMSLEYVCESPLDEFVC